MTAKTPCPHIFAIDFFCCFNIDDSFYENFENFCLCGSIIVNYISL